MTSKPHSTPEWPDKPLTAHRVYQLINGRQEDDRTVIDLMAALRSLEEQLEALQDEKAKAQQFGGDRDDRIQALETALQRIYWNGCNGFVEETIIVVLSPEQRFAWAEAHNPASEPEAS